MGFGVLTLESVFLAVTVSNDKILYFSGERFSLLVSLLIFIISSVSGADAAEADLMLLCDWAELIKTTDADLRPRFETELS